jgi:peptide/nickel transport system substrate-binding protein
MRVRLSRFSSSLKGIFLRLFRGFFSASTPTSTVEQFQRMKGNGWPTLTQCLQMRRMLPAPERRQLTLALGSFLLGIVLLGGSWYSTHRELVPAVGGSYTEGLVGTPQFINPLYATSSDTDADLTRLVYSGLMAWDPVAGLVPSLAATYTISDDGKVYTLSLRQNALWHDGTPVTARDVLFTFTTIQDPAANSPLAASFRGVNVSQIDEHTVSFTLSSPFAPFLSALTVGILPAHVWEEVNPASLRLAEQNLSPVGSGPYAFDSYEKAKNGSILSYTLTRFPDYFEQPAHIATLTARFYADQTAAVQAWENHEVDGLAFADAVTAHQASTTKDSAVFQPTLPQITALFFNTRNDVLSTKYTRFALASAIDKTAILGDTLSSEGRIVHTPVPQEYLGAPFENPFPFSVEKAATFLDTAGWKAGTDGMRTQGSGANQKTLTLTLATVDQPEFVAVANRIAQAWTSLGITVTVKPVSVADMRTVIVQNHAFDAFLGSVLLGATADPYSFWHSSQTQAGGLNVAGWQHRQADAFITQARTQTNPDKRKEALTSFAKLLQEDMPAVFLAQPTYSYIVASRIRGVQLQQILVPSDRLGQVNQWYIKTKRSFAW